MLPSVEFAFNNVKAKGSGHIPSVLLFGIRQKGEVTDKIGEYFRNMERPIDTKEVREEAAQNIKVLQKYNEDYYNKKRKESHKYNVGDLVLISNVDTTINMNKKLIPKYKGPYIVNKVLGNDRYIIKDLDGFQITNKKFESVYEAGKLKPYVKID